jgi:hypothetical protein
VSIIFLSNLPLAIRLNSIPVENHDYGNVEFNRLYPYLKWQGKNTRHQKRFGLKKSNNERPYMYQPDPTLSPRNHKKFDQKACLFIALDLSGF